MAPIAGTSAAALRRRNAAESRGQEHLLPAGSWERIQVPGRPALSAAYPLRKTPAFLGIDEARVPPVDLVPDKIMHTTSTRKRRRRNRKKT